VAGLTKYAALHRHWLQGNRIDGADAQHSVVMMKQTERKEASERAPHLCKRCGGLMRLIGSERHPVEVSTDLLTYCCTSCDEFLVLPVEKATRLRSVESASRFVNDNFQNRISIKPLSHLKADNSHVTPITFENCRGKAHLTDRGPCALSVGIREIWTFKCETCSEYAKRIVES